MNKLEGLRTNAARAAVIAAAIVLGAAVAASAFSLWPHDLQTQPRPYLVGGYLDRAPAGTKLVDQIQISVNRHERTLLITSYGYGEITFDLHLSRNMARPYLIRGPQADLDRIAAAPPGTRLEGTFEAYTGGPPWLLIADLDFPTEDDKAKSAS